MASLAPRDVYYCVVTCEGCGRRVRASTILQHWSKRPQASFGDAEQMLTRSDGPRRIRNEVLPLWDALRAMRDVGARRVAGERLQMFFEALERRYSDAARQAREAARRARWG